MFSKNGKPAQPKPGQQRCSFCDPALLNQVLEKENGKNRLQQLFSNIPEYTVEVALRRLPADLQEEFRSARLAAEAKANDPGEEGVENKRRRKEK